MLSLAEELALGRLATVLFQRLNQKLETRRSTLEREVVPNHYHSGFWFLVYSLITNPLTQLPQFDLDSADFRGVSGRK